MEKKRRSVSEQNEDHRSCYFDSLPDEVAENIIDRLGWMDAAKTSVLSHRLYNVWKTCIHYKKNLYFEEFWRLSGSNFVEFVNHILHTHEGSKVDSLTIVFCYISSKRDIDLAIKVRDSLENWVTFARAKCVSSLGIDLDQHNWKLSPQIPLFQLGGWDKLTSLSLKSVEVDDDDLELGLKSHLINLESLVIQRASRLKRVVIASPKLKKLEIVDCSNINIIDIASAPNLQCFKTWFADNVRAYVRFRHVPKLSHVSLGGGSLCRLNMSELRKVGTLEKLEMRGPTAWKLGKYGVYLYMFKAWDKLTSLSLSSVELHDSELVISERDFSNLESMFIDNALKFKRLVVDSGKLKELKITCRDRIGSIRIDYAPNLQYLGCRGDEIEHVHFNDHVLNKLSHVSLDAGETCCLNMLSVLEKVETLEKLELEVTLSCKHVGCRTKPPYFPVLGNLKELECTVFLMSEWSKSKVALVILGVILAACPKLHKLTINAWGDLEMGSEKDEWFDLRRDGQHTTSLKHHCLKEVVFFSPNRVEAFTYLKQIAPNLEHFC